MTEETKPDSIVDQDMINPPAEVDLIAPVAEAAEVEIEEPEVELVSEEIKQVEIIESDSEVSNPEPSELPQEVEETDSIAEASEPVESITLDEPANESNSETVPEEIVAKKEPRTEAEILEQVREVVSEIDAISVTALEADSRMEQAGEALEEKTKLHEEFQDWYERRKASYAWKLVDKLTAYKTNLEKDEKQLRDFAASESALKEGFGEASQN